MTPFTSQAGQDRWVCDFFQNKKEGYFLDIGAYNPIYLSNTYYLEKELNWKGLLVEASKFLCDAIISGRTNTCVNKAIHNENKVIRFTSNNWAGGINDNGLEIVEAITFEKLLKDFNCPKVIDYVSLDIEGNEYKALLGFPFNDYDVILWTIEHNVYNGGECIEAKNNIFDLLTKNGYTRTHNNVNCGGDPHFPFEDWYVNNKYLPK